MDIKWTCHACGRERPDELISVAKRPLDRDGMTINVRYCNDNPKCKEAAEKVQSLKDFSGLQRDGW